MTANCQPCFEQGRPNIPATHLSGGERLCTGCLLDDPGLVPSKLCGGCGANLPAFATGEYCSSNCGLRTTRRDTVPLSDAKPKTTAKKKLCRFCRAPVSRGSLTRLCRLHSCWYREVHKKTPAVTVDEWVKSVKEPIAA